MNIPSFSGRVSLPQPATRNIQPSRVAFAGDLSGKQSKARLEETDSYRRAVDKLAEGNAFATMALLDMTGSKPGSSAAREVLESLDHCQVYGRRIYNLYDNVAKGNARDAAALLKATVKGVIDQKTLDRAIDHYGEGLDVKSVALMVRDDDPGFVGLNEMA